MHAIGMQRTLVSTIMPLSMSHGIPAGLRYALFDHSIEHDFGEQRLLNSFSTEKSYVLYIVRKTECLHWSKINSERS